MSRAPQNQPDACHACGGTGFATSDPEDSSLCLDCHGSGEQAVAPAREHHMSDHADTVREQIVCRQHKMYDCSPLLNGCSNVIEAHAALDALVAERDEARQALEAEQERRQSDFRHANYIASCAEEDAAKLIARAEAAEADRDRYAAALRQISTLRLDEDEDQSLAYVTDKARREMQTIARAALKDET